MKINKISLLLTILILLQGFLIRFIYIGKIPAGLDIVLKERVIIAIVSLLSIPLLKYITKKITGSLQLGFLAGWFLSIFPWHIEQSRIYSMYPLLLFLILLYFFILLNTSKTIRIISTFFLLASIFLIKPFWFLINPFLYQYNYSKFIANLFQLTSFGFIFFKNDSFWSGGFRNFGILFPETIPLFIIGLYSLLKKRIGIILLVISLVLAVITSLNTNFPETREFFFIIPIFSIVLALGAQKLSLLIRSSSVFLRILSYVYLIVFIYGLFQFFHFYFVHYNLRIYQEKLYETKQF